MTESALVSEIMVAASDRGHRLFINSSGVARYKKAGRAYAVPYGCGGPGTPDLWGWTASGHFVAIEVKVRGKKPKPHQDAWISAAKQSCPTLRIGWADSVEGALEILEGKNVPKETT